jgi:hypothetical protein
MGSLRANAIALFTGLSLFVTYMDHAMAQACASLASNHTGTYTVGAGDIWDWTTTGALYLNQNSSGGITGYMNAYVSSSCPSGAVYNINGALNNGQFSFTAAYTGSDSGCAPIISASGTLTGPGCATASGSWTNDRGLGPLPLAMTQACQYPTGETPSVFTGWHSEAGSSYNLTAADYNVTPAPTTTYNWGGRTITEEFLQPSDDTCWFKGSPIPKATPIAAGPFKMTGNNGYSDTVGPSQLAVNTYRRLGKTPCGFINYQTMVIDCPNPPGNQSFAAVTQIVDIDDVMVGASRAGVQASRNWGTPAPIITLTPLMNLLLLKH